jgi:AcrR family transcriptional regulator
MRRTRGPRTAEAIQEAAAELFFRQGYAGTSLREIASSVGIQVGSLYNHIEGKEDLLSRLMEHTMADLLAAMRAAVTGLEDPVQRLRAGLDCHIRFHATRSRDVFIGNTELRALPPRERRRVVAARDEYERLITGLVADAVAGQPTTTAVDLRLHTYAIVAIGTHVATWYRPQGSMSLDHVVQSYTDAILRQLGLTPRTAPAQPLGMP